MRILLPFIQIFLFFIPSGNILFSSGNYIFYSGNIFFSGGNNIFIGRNEFLGGGNAIWNRSYTSRLLPLEVFKELARSSAS
jgi:hypothetical protein